MRTFLLFGLAIGCAAGAGWPQWGGPTRNFHVAGTVLTTSWPAAGPRELWRRDLGFGHSSVVTDDAGKTLFTMYRSGGDEVVIALDALTGRTVWEFRYAAPFLDGMNMDVGPGPHATPLLYEDRLYTAGVTGKLHCLDARTGKMLWRKGVVEELGGTVMVRGYSSSPLAWRGTVIVQVGGQNKALVALDAKTGRSIWSRQDFKNSHASPVIIRVGGQDQVAVLMDKVIAGINPADGDLLWSHPHDTIGDHTAGTPVWSPDGLLFVSSAYDGGSRVVELTRTGWKTLVKELWAHKRMRVHHSNVIRVGDYFYGTSGDFGPAFFQAVNARTGEVRLQERGFARANSLDLGDGRALVLDENGVLALCRLSPDGIQILTKAQVMENKAWTPPTLVGTKLYLRDRKTIRAFDLP
jgi:outer membrane protein assembly factor BamB